jgi:TPR repeat protein
MVVQLIERLGRSIVNTRSRRSPRFALGCVLLVSLTAAAQQTPDPATAAQLYEEGRDLLAGGDAIHARLRWVDAAELGSSDAENEVGKLYFLGQGVDPSSDEALYWFLRSANHGNLRGMTNAGLMYFGDRGVNADYTKAAQWLPKPAAEGIALAQCGLGMLYANGWGVEQDFARAFELQTKAAEQGNVDAYNELGKLYLFGHGVKQDSTAALDWFRKSSDGGSIRGMTNLGLMYLGDRGVPADLDEALRLLTQAAEQGQAIAQFNLGMMYADGKGVAKDSARALPWLLKAAQQGVAEAKIMVGDYYLEGDDDAGVMQDLDTAVAYYKSAIQSHEPQVLAEVAERLLDPESDIFDADAARPLLVESANAGNAEGQYELAEECRIDKDFVRAAELYKLSADQGYLSALDELADLYLKGEGVERSAVNAYVTAALAIERGASWKSGTRDQAARELTPAQLEEAQAEIARRKAAWK